MSASDKKQRKKVLGGRITLLTSSIEKAEEGFESRAEQLRKEGKTEELAIAKAERDKQVALLREKKAAATMELSQLTFEIVPKKLQHATEEKDGEGDAMDIDAEIAPNDKVAAVEPTSQVELPQELPQGVQNMAEAKASKKRARDDNAPAQEPLKTTQNKSGKKNSSKTTGPKRVPKTPASKNIQIVGDHECAAELEALKAQKEDMLTELQTIRISECFNTALAICDFRAFSGPSDNDDWLVTRLVESLVLSRIGETEDQMLKRAMSLWNLAAISYHQRTRAQGHPKVVKALKAKASKDGGWTTQVDWENSPESHPTVDKAAAAIVVDSIEGTSQVSKQVSQ